MDLNARNPFLQDARNRTGLNSPFRPGGNLHHPSEERLLATEEDYKRLESLIDDDLEFDVDDEELIGGTFGGQSADLSSLFVGEDTDDFGLDDLKEAERAERLAKAEEEKESQGKKSANRESKKKKESEATTKKEAKSKIPSGRLECMDCGYKMSASSPPERKPIFISPGKFLCKLCDDSQNIDGGLVQGHKFASTVKLDKIVATEYTIDTDNVTDYFEVDKKERKKNTLVKALIVVALLAFSVLLVLSVTARPDAIVPIRFSTPSTVPTLLGARPDTPAAPAARRISTRISSDRGTLSIINTSEQITRNITIQTSNDNFITNFFTPRHQCSISSEIDFCLKAIASNGSGRNFNIFVFNDLARHSMLHVLQGFNNFFDEDADASTGVSAHGTSNVFWGVWTSSYIYLFDDGTGLVITAHDGAPVVNLGLSISTERTN